MSQADDAVAELEKRWKAVFKAQAYCMGGIDRPKIDGRQARNITGENGRRYEPFGQALKRGVKPEEIAAFRSDLVAAEQVMKENGCSVGEGTGIAYGQGAGTTLSDFDIEQATAALKAAAAVDKGASELEGGAKGFWDGIPLAAKVAGGATLLAVLLGNVARIMRR